jgi:UDP:flavonoid glycosyltransferase YjiC (YdhE family)
MESLAAGKPVLAWPMMAEQHLNAKHVADIIGAGVRMNLVDNKVIVDRAEVEKMVRRLMDAGSKEGREMRARAAWAQQEAKLAVSDGGMSHMALLELVDELQGSYDRDASA